jgi:hypothetical protein
MRGTNEVVDARSKPGGCVPWKRPSQHDPRDGRKNGLVKEVTQVVIKTSEDGEREEENGSAP